jgi:Icc-related predicted phosphoesterase
MLIAFASDTHGSEQELKIPEVDIFCHCGDWSGIASINDVIFFNRWLGTIPAKHKVIISGNHEKYCAENSPGYIQSLFTNAIYLEHSMVEIEGLKIFGSPYTSRFYNWYFMKEKEELERVWSTIPDKVDILLTHQPPFGILDTIHEYKKMPTPVGWDDDGEVRYGNYSSSFKGGCKYLYDNVVNRIKPKIHAYGHLHSDGGQSVKHLNTTFVKAAMLTEFYTLRKPEPVVIEI